MKEEVHYIQPQTTHPFHSQEIFLTEGYSSTTSAPHAALGLLESEASSPPGPHHALFFNQLSPLKKPNN